MIDEPLKDGVDGTTDRQRAVSKRSSYLERVHDLRETQAEAVAWKEHGFTDSSIARKMDSTKSTVKGWIDDVEDEFGIEAVVPKPEDERSDPLGS